MYFNHINHRVSVFVFDMQVASSAGFVSAEGEGQEKS